MKKMIIALLLSLTFSSSILYASNADYMRQMAHANPVPNYMSIIKMNADKLGLNEEQKNQVMVWKNKNGEKMAVMVKSVMAGEKEIKLASMNGVSSSEIATMSNNLMDTRKKIIAGKTTCRDYMMKVLTEAQWKQLTDMMKAG